MLAEAVGRWLATDYDFARRRRLAAGEEPWESNWRQLADLGLLGLNVPESEGGMGGGSVEALIVMQALGRALVVEPYVQTALVSAPLLAQSGSAAQREDLLPQIVSGDLRVVVAALEPGARYDLHAGGYAGRPAWRRFRAVRQQSRGRRRESAHRLIVSARTSGAVRDGSRHLAVPRTGRCSRRGDQARADHRRIARGRELRCVTSTFRRRRSSVRWTTGSNCSNAQSIVAWPRSAPKPSARWSGCSR